MYYVYESRGIATAKGPGLVKVLSLFGLGMVYLTLCGERYQDVCIFLVDVDD